jgi:transcription elongation factor GreA
MTDAVESIWMTPEALAALEAELVTVSGSDATDAEKARAIELRQLIRRAEVGTKPDDGLVEPGMKVSVRFTADDSTETFVLGSREVLSTAAGDLEVYSPTSPLGLAITGRYVGDTATYSAPTGADLEVEILEAVPFG